MQTCKKCFREIGEYPFCPYCGASQGSNLLTLEQIYSEWSTLYFRKVGRKSREGYENAWRTLHFLGQYAMSDIKISDYQLAMDTLQNKSRSLQNKLLLLIGQLCKYAVAVHRLDVINPSPYLILDGVQAKSREIFSDEEISRLFCMLKRTSVFLVLQEKFLFLSSPAYDQKNFLELRKTMSAYNTISFLPGVVKPMQVKSESFLLSPKSCRMCFPFTLHEAKRTT